ncbi:MAG: SDR family oxidoreductase [Spirochaetota bacterium]
MGVTNKKILILGASGMLGHTLLYELLNKGFTVYGTVRDMSSVRNHFPNNMLDKIINNVNAGNINLIKEVIDNLDPDIVINCIGIIKQIPVSKEPLPVIAVNSLFPHQIASICKEKNRKMIHISTDCVFDGRKGLYTEDDRLSAEDLYGISKYMGEVKYDHTLTIRTSIIGHELNSKLSLIEWFLSQNTAINGYTKAIYTGFPTVEIANIIADYVIPDQNLSGLYHVSSNPISKYELLKIVSKFYGKKIEIKQYDDFYDNKSLVSERFKLKTGYKPPDWNILIEKMYENFKQFGYKRNF